MDVCVSGTGIRMHRHQQPLSILPGTGPEPFKPRLQKGNPRHIVGKTKLSTWSPAESLQACVWQEKPAVVQQCPPLELEGPQAMALCRSTTAGGYRRSLAPLHGVPKVHQDGCAVCPGSLQVLPGAGGWCSQPCHQPCHRGGSQFVPSAPSPPRWLLVALACCFINNSRSDALVA